MDERRAMTDNQADDASPTLFTRLFGATRHVMTAAVLAVFLGATVLLVLGMVEMASAVWQAIPGNRTGETDSLALRIAVIEAVDIILVATVLFVIAFGLYQLFVDHALRSRLPEWLQISAIGDLEVRLAGMVITVLAIIALTRALEAHGTGGSGIGYEIAAVIAAISLFLYQEKKSDSNRGEGEE
jgi:uncharacterized membrane protein YqhA